VLFSIAPLTIVLVSMFGLVLQDDSIRNDVVNAIIGELPVSPGQRPPVDAQAQLGRLTASVRQLAAQLDGATFVPLRKALQPGVIPMSIGNARVVPTVELTRRFDSPRGGKSYRGESQLYVATPAVLT
jgi:hypothetical protein